MQRQIEYIGAGCLNRMADILHREKARTVFLVAGPHAYRASGAQETLAPLLATYATTRFDAVTPNPAQQTIENAFRLFSAAPGDVILAVGGGSTIDVAKAVKQRHVAASGHRVPLVAVPTTAGSGSEATWFVVYYQNGVKQSDGRPDVTLPDYALIDPELIRNLPPPVAAASGMDALSQAIESYWSIHSTPLSRDYARRAIQGLDRHLQAAVCRATPDHQKAVMQAANLAGKAINITRTTACHAVSYPLSARFGIAHGHAVALTLGAMLVFNDGVTPVDCLDLRGPSAVRRRLQEICKLLGCRTPEDARRRLGRLMQAIGLETRLSRLGLARTDIAAVVARAFAPERLRNAPRLLDACALTAILEEIY